MALTSIGDLGRLFQSRTQAAALRGRADRLSAEMTTGLRQNLRSPTSGEMGQLLALRRDQRLLESYRVAAAEATARAGATQTALEMVGASVGQIAPGLSLAAFTAQPGQMATAAATARGAFASVVASLNGTVAGASLFSGVLSDHPALIEADAMLAMLGAATAGETTVQGLSDAITAWFGPGGDYETQAFLGDPATATSRIDGGESLSLPVTALDPGLRTILGGLALAVLSGQLASDPAAQAGALTAASDRLLNGQSAIIETRARLGVTEGRIEARVAEIASRKTSLAQAELRITGVDPYEAATALNEVTNRLDSLYAVTARLSRLSLLEYLR